MGLENTKDGKLLYHLTELDNLESIIENGLAPRKFLLEKTVKFQDVANPAIINKREALGLDIYVPFHFHPYSAFDVAVKNTHGEKEMIYLCITRELAQNKHFKILPKHPLSLEECNLYEYEEGFQMIDWEILMEVGRSDEKAKHIKMAECLSELVLPVAWIQCIYVSSDDVKNKIEDLLKGKNIDFPPPYINLQSKWFE